MKAWFSTGAVIGAALAAAPFVVADPSEVPQDALDARIIVLGEQHDNPDHHARQAHWVASLQPKALVFEMLTPQQATAAAGVARDDREALDAALGWSETSWPAFEMYHPIFAAAPDAAIYGAGVPRSEIMTALDSSLAEHPTAAAYGLAGPPDPDEQALRTALQADAHCGKLPDEMLPVMVDAQRLRDMTLADVSLRALRATGGPVAVITGNGHARMDWGMPALLEHAAPDLPVFVLLQSEGGGDVAGGGSLTLDAPAPPREDPCAAFRD